MNSFDAADRARDLRTSGMMGRFLLVGIGVWLHAADSLVTATIAPAIALDPNKVRDDATQQRRLRNYVKQRRPLQIAQG